MWPEGEDSCRTVGCHAWPCWRRQTLSRFLPESCQWMMARLPWDPVMTFPRYSRRSPPFCKPKSAAFYCFVCIPCVPVGMWSHVQVHIWRPEINISSFLAAPHLILLRQSLSLNLELTNWLDWVASKLMISHSPLVYSYPLCPHTHAQCWNSCPVSPSLAFYVLGSKLRSSCLGYIHLALSHLLNS